MDHILYLDKFKNILDDYELEQLRENQLDFSVGIYFSSVVLKIQKKAWLNNNASAKPFKESVFFCVWINDDLIKTGKLFYNIHALKMRELSRYTIKSRDFAQAFREKFEPYQTDWPNVSTAFGPLTLMEGWIDVDAENFKAEVKFLCARFLAMQHIIDELLAERRK